MSIKFKILSSPPSNVEIKFLYHLLQARSSSISHKHLPSYSDHTDFVRNHPYRSWYIIYLNLDPIGSLYLSTDNSVGLHVLEKHNTCLQHILIEFSHLFHPLPGIKSLRSKYFFFNLPPDNSDLKEALESLGYFITQTSYTKID